VTPFATAVALTRREVFDALEACAEAERALLRCGRPVEAAGVASLFELLEDRVLLDPLPAASTCRSPRHVVDSVAPAGSVAPAPSAEPAVSEPFGSNSSDSEFTQ
jgi:hypothetical protein